MRQAEEPLPPRPLPTPVRTEPTRRPWPVTATPAPQPDAAPIALPNTLNGDPNGLKREDINDALQAALPALAACFPGPDGPPSIGLAFDAEPDGRASNVKVTGAPPEAERCVSTTLARVKLPVFQGKSVPVQFPISVFRQPPPPRAPVAAEPPPSAPTPPPIAGATVAPTPPPGTSTAPYVPTSSIQPTAGSAPSDDQIKTFIKP